MSSPSLPPSVRPTSRSGAKLRKNRWKWILIDFFILPFLPSFFLLFLLKFSHAKLSKKGQRNRFSLPVSEKDYVFGASAGFLALLLLTMFPAVFWFLAARPLCKGIRGRIRI